MDQTQITKVYLCRFVSSLLGSVSNGELIKSICDDLYTLLYNRQPSLANIYEVPNMVAVFQKKVAFAGGGSVDWDNFRTNIEKLLSCQNTDDITQHLLMADAMNNQAPQTSFHTNSFLDASNMEPPLNDLIVPYYYKVESFELLSEEEILKYLCYTLIGSNSELFPFDGENRVVLPKNINQSLSGVLHRLLEPALLFRDITQRIELEKHHCRIKAAFFAELQTRLQLYVKSVNLVTQRVTTCNQVLLELYDDIIKLRFFHFLLEKSSEDHFLTLLFSLQSHGDKMLAQLSRLFFLKAVQPFVDAMVDWVLKGEVNSDFFVEGEKFKFVPSKLPSFISLPLGEKIYQIGKCVRCLWHECRKLDWCDVYFKKYSSLVDSWRFKGCDFQHLLAELIDVQYAEVVNYCHSVIFSEYSLMAHLRNLHKFLLMQQGDLIDGIICKGYTSLNEPSRKLTSHELTSILQDAISHSSVAPCDNLDARVLEFDHGTIGWDVFTLDYRLPHQLEVALNNEQQNCSKEYLRMFNFLFKIRRIGYMLDVAWQDNHFLRKNILSKHVKQVKRLKRESRNAYLLSEQEAKLDKLMDGFLLLNLFRFQFTKFIDKVLNFFYFDVIERSFHTLNEKLGKEREPNSFLNEAFIASVNLENNTNDLGLPRTTEKAQLNLDELASVHYQYLISITRNKVLNNSGSHSTGSKSSLYYIHQLSSLISLIYKFLILQEEFSNNIGELILTWNLSKTNADEAQVLEEYQLALESKLGVLIKTLRSDIGQKYSATLETFVEDLVKDEDVQLKYFGIMLSE